MQYYDNKMYIYNEYKQTLNNMWLPWKRLPHHLLHELCEHGVREDTDESLEEGECRLDDFPRPRLEQETHTVHQGTQQGLTDSVWGHDTLTVIVDHIVTVLRDHIVTVLRDHIITHK